MVQGGLLRNGGHCEYVDSMVSMDNDNIGFVIVQKNFVYLKLLVDTLG